MRTLTLLLFSGVLALSAADDKKEGKMTGCLTKDAAGAYTLQSEDGKKVAVMGSADLEKHSANHKVTLHGSEKNQDGKTMFHVDQVEHVSASCSAAPPAKQ